MSLLQIAAEAAAEPETMTRPGWIIMIVSVGSVLALTAFCLYRVLTLPPSVAEEHLKGPLVIDTGDTENAD
jgi:hypothetical protein